MSSDDDHLIGRLGYVTTRIVGPARPGEVQVRLGQGSEAFIAFATEPIDRGAQVMVVGRRPGRVLEVTAFDG
jgi:membrane protein implicated in regulation of membrane protease activity